MRLVDKFKTLIEQNGTDEIGEMGKASWPIKSTIFEGYYVDYL